MKKQELYDRIEAYLTGSMSPREQADFENEMKSDDNLRQEVEFHQELAEATKGETFHQLRNVLQQTDAGWNNEKARTGGRVISLSFMKIAVAASVVVLMGVALWMNLSSPASGPELYASHFEPYDMVLTQRSLEGATNEQLESAIGNYANENYEEAELQFRALATSSPDEPVLKMYECISALAQGNSKSSIDCFGSLLTITALAEQARWYLGLAYLQAGDEKQALEIFNQIGEREYKYEEAKEILEELAK